jgi:hypothetical protein
MTNLVQKVRDWLEAQQAGGTNSSATNGAAHDAWVSLTNWLAMHASSSTNAAGTNSLSGTNLLQKLQDWLATEQQAHTNTTNNASTALDALSGYVASISTNQPATNNAATNSTPASRLLRGIGGLLGR